MADLKGVGVVTDELPPEMDNPNLSPEKKGTHEDQRDMFRMGKAQEMRVSTAPDHHLQNRLLTVLRSEISVSYRFSVSLCW
jgi:hypothetical protein